MKLIPCPFCGKAIPARMNTCPYCHRDEKGAPVVMDSHEPASAAKEFTPAQLERELQDLTKDDAYAREQAITRLAQYGLRATMALVAVLADHSKTGLAGVAKALGLIADKRSISALSQAVKQGDDGLRTAALWALAQFRDPEVLPVLLSEAERVHPVTQHYLAHVLGNFHDARVVPVLSRLALRGSPEVVYQAAFALGEWNERESIDALKRTARRSDLLQRTVALASLNRLGFGAPLRWQSKSVWITAACCLAIFIGGLCWLHK